MLFVTNPAGWVFVWPNGSDYIEVYRDDVGYPDVPVEVLYAGDLKYNESELKRLANESPEYGRSYV